MGRSGRVLGLGQSYYHAMNRVVRKNFLLGAPEKEHLVALARQVSGFTGVEILAFCVMDNHYHLLLKVPDRPAEITEEEIYRRMAALYKAKEISQLQKEISALRAAGCGERAEEILERYRVRMFSLEQFMKTLGQRFANWYNREHQESGPFWDGRYKSVLLEPPSSTDRRPHAGESTLLTMGAYIDLNPIRAGMVEDPKDYRWSSYAAAVAGDPLAQAGLREILAVRNHSGSWEDVSASYRQLLYGIGEESGLKEDGTALHRGLTRDQVARVKQEKGRLPTATVLRCRIRYFTNGVAIGSRSFVESTYARVKEQLGLKRETGAKPIKLPDDPETAWGDWCSMRHLRN